MGKFEGKAYENRPWLARLSRPQPSRCAAQVLGVVLYTERAWRLGGLKPTLCSERGGRRKAITAIPTSHHLIKGNRPPSGIFILMFAMKKRTSATTAPAPWDVLRRICSAHSAELAAAASAASRLGLESPLELSDLSLADMSMLLPSVEPIHLLKLRSTVSRPHQFIDQAYGPAAAAVENHLPPSDGNISPVPGLHPTAYFFGKIMSQNPHTIGNQRLGLWFEVTLLMATLLFSLALSIALQPTDACRNRADDNVCETLLVADQIVWSFGALAMWAGSSLMWVASMVVIMLSPDEARAFVSNHVRLTSWGVLVTLLGVFCFMPGIVLRVWVLSSSRVAQYATVAIASFWCIFFQVVGYTLMLRVVGGTWRQFPAILLGGFGLLPGTNRFRSRM